VKQFMLPLWKQVVFVDWQGVLSNDVFWKSILTSRRHPVRHQLENKLGDIFNIDRNISHDWMRGRRSSADIISAMRITLPSHFGHDYLHRQLIADLIRTEINSELVELLKLYLSKAFIVVATDNMDCTANIFEDLRKRAYRHGGSADTLATWASLCDDIVCSSDVGKLKSEDPETFFGSWLSAYRLTFADALLIDDRAVNCEAFVSAGGSAIQWKMGSDHINELMQSLERWFE